jgi:hypothetical protein
MNLAGVVADDDIEAVIGPILSDRGTSRIVHAMAGDDSWVIKESRNPPHSANLTEWDDWTEIAGSGMADIFAECRAISKTGKYLIMERLDPDPGGLARPDTPSWLTDRKPSCLGAAADQRLKVLDYGQVKPLAGGRAGAPLQPWPSGTEVERMRELRRILDADGDDCE